MQNSYIIDAFLTGTLWLALAFLFFDSKARIKELDTLMSSHTLALALTSQFKRAAFIAVPFIVLMFFLLWRFYALMVASETLGAGGFGLLVIIGLMSLLGTGLYALLVCVRNSPYATFTEKIADVKTQTSNQNSASSKWSKS